ncbi:uncharacterized protein LOC113206613 [Frankliniella occidentalis]|uniref:Uncharacterized protein LOC113206613 n=1 Tax=Frankliniella occidentalis TaxID=133901 RepID=A0A6J1SGU0_FRAOC|nr:uncharacterized protein LOC113206613 [Frankliniella occidentalis]
MSQWQRIRDFLDLVNEPNMHQQHQQHGDGGEENEQESSPEVLLEGISWVTNEIFNGFLRTHTLNVNLSVDPAIVLIGERERACELITIDFMYHNGVKFHLNLNVEMTKVELTTGDITSTKPYFASKTVTVVNIDQIFNFYEECVMQISEKIANFNENGSNFTVYRVIKFEIHTVGYRPLSAGSFLPLPPHVQSKKACINLKNSDNRCFLYSVLLGLNIENVNVKRVAEKPSLLLKYEDQLDMTGIKYPVKLCQINKIEIQNKNIALTIIGYSKSDGFFPLRTSKALLDPHRTRVDLLYIKPETTDGSARKRKRKGRSPGRSYVLDEARDDDDDDDEEEEEEEGEEENDGETKNTGHYIFIKNLNRLLSQCKSKKNGRKFTCRNCFYQASFKLYLTAHEKHCLSMDCQRIDFPLKGKMKYLSNMHVTL